MKKVKPAIIIANDHGGENLKKLLVKTLAVKYQITVLDHRFNPHDDYPNQAASLAQYVIKNPGAKGVAICRSGVGMCIVANKFPGIRAIAADRGVIVKRARQDEDINILCLGADYLNSRQARLLINIFIKTPFKPLPRYTRRLREIKSYESKS